MANSLTIIGDLGTQITIENASGDQRRPRISWDLINANYTVVYGVYLQSLDNGVLVGATQTLAAQTGIREQTPAVGCSPSSTFCVSVYRWFNPADTQTGVDRIKAKTIIYP